MMIEPEARITYNGLTFNSENPTSETVVVPERVLRTNWVTNPTPTSTSGWGGVDATVAPAPWSSSRSMVVSTSGGSTLYVRTAVSQRAYVTGETVHWRVKVWSDTAGVVGARLSVRAPSANLGAFVDVTLAANGWTEVTGSFVMDRDVLAGQLDITIAPRPTGGAPAGVKIGAGDVLIGEPGPFFTGSPPQAFGKHYRWTGLPNASTSEEYLPAESYVRSVPGPAWHVTTVDGIGDPAAVYAREKRVQAAGDWMGRAYKGSGAMGMSGYTVCTSSAEADRMTTLLRRTVALEDAPLTLHWASGDRTRMVRRDGEIVITRPTPTMFEWSFTVVASDPAWYEGSGDDGVNTYSTRLPSSTGGLAFPVTFPITFTGTSSTGDIVIENDGDGGRWQFRIDGPVVNPRITVANSAGTRTLAWSLSLGGGEFLEVDPQRQESLLQGQASRPPYLRQWPTFLPGLNVVRFRADSGGAAAKLTVATRTAL